jgi:hypothetical protein
MAKRLWLTVAACAVTAAFLGCQSDVTEPTRVKPAGMDNGVTMIEGYVTVLGTPQPIPDALVWAVLQIPDPPSITIGSDYTNNAGWYEIKGFEKVWERYEGEEIHVFADHEDYQEGGPEIIASFSLEDIPYRIDFELVAD